MDREFVYSEKIVPYVRMTQRGKYVKKGAQDYLSSKASLGYAFKKQMEEYLKINDKTPFEIEIEYYAPNIFQFDLDNLVKAVLDAGNGIIYTDDRWCQSFERIFKERKKFYYLRFIVREFEK